MASPIIDATIQEITTTTGVVESAVVLINSFGKMVTDAVTKALEGGATAAQLEPFNEVTAILAAKRKELSEAVLANTPNAKR